jgi:S1-C subfamily serine protease
MPQPTSLTTAPETSSDSPSEVNRRTLALGIGVSLVAVVAVAGVARSLHARTPAAAPTAAPVAPSVANTSDPASKALDKDPPPIPAKFEVTDPPVLSIEELVSRTIPAVVTVETSSGTGSGFFVSTDTALTNKHVVESQEDVTVRRSGGRTVAAHVESSSWDFDLAVLKVAVADPGQVFLPMALPSDVRVGGEVIAIGSPLGLQNTVTRGIVSGTREYRGITVIQTDAAINPGNSGGPLIDRQGRVIGINTMKLAGYELQSIGFAVSTRYAMRMLGADFGIAAERELQRQKDLAGYEQAIAAMASTADAVEQRWKGFRSSCFADPDSSAATPHEWFALADGRAFVLHDVAHCRSWRTYFAESAARLKDGMKDAEGRASASGIAVDLTRRIRRKYKMFWPDWDRV